MRGPHLIETGGAWFSPRPVLPVRRANISANSHAGQPLGVLMPSLIPDARKIPTQPLRH
jgi:hypothetical protein